MNFDDAVGELYRAPHAEFVATRKRLAGELKAAGDKPGAAALGKLARPPVSAWAVNQLWWQARDDFERLFATAERLRKGELAAQAEHRAALAALRAHAAKLLDSPNEATLRRITTTLSALAVDGTFDGRLAEDRDPPGFAAAGVINEPAVVNVDVNVNVNERAEREARERSERERAERAERDRVEAQRQRERARLERELLEARERVVALERALAALAPTT